MLPRMDVIVLIGKQPVLGRMLLMKVFGEETSNPSYPGDPAVCVRYLS